ncbi:BspA family leucine-rich repeat surface protein [Brachyspira pilosicoli]|uniref:BspA family leucine-rich repeat surface protein n=1 Tax=Brachyspira pilosicoli TaxID=52584 RepID=A0AAJ6GFI3_BRAPL|nr:BspA family leucine-rich repeat surface protein [Brachyspira pilosicoli]WIH91404.1 BspA family leucine-rich repeat surface protein [Brachyspira pilosicoli]WIH93695.1 BspA family leucine-rich repeat surface protein [Brachyspira pilosicoli]WIH95984.1 BspA family leucine-rich repeat surface protein [Brachyspira pilosicoli]
MKKYKPTTKTELKKLVFTDGIKLYDVDTSLITDMSKLFYESKRKDFEGIEDWDVSNVTNMDMMFAYMGYNMLVRYSSIDFDQDLSNWNVSKVTSMNNMFAYCSNFDQPLDNWDVSNVEDMSFMFCGAKEFNQPLNSWNTSKVKNMRGMFQECEFFNQPLDKWDTSNVEDMSNMFIRAKRFNKPLNTWNINKVKDLSSMFAYCDAFNQNINDWDVSNVTNMDSLFRQCDKLNQPFDKWDTSNVVNMEKTFFSCTKFNQPLNSWNVSNVENMDMMFYMAQSFNQPLDKWNTQKLITAAGLFRFAYKYDCYESLENWNLDNLQEVGTFCDDEEKLHTRLKVYMQVFYPKENYITITNNNAKEIYNLILKDKNKKIVRLRKKIESDFREELSISEDNFATIEDAENYIKNNYKEDKRLKFINNTNVLIKDKSREVNIKVIKYIYSEYLSLSNIIRLKRIDDIVNLLDMETFVKQIKEFYLENKGDAACLIYGIYGGDEALKDIYELKFDSNFFLSLIKLNIKHKYALKLLYEIYTTTKKRDIKKEASKIIDEVLEKMNISYSEFKLKCMPNLGFNSKGEREFNKDYKLILNSDYSLSLFDIKNNKILKSMPKKINEDLKEEIQNLEKEIYKFIRANSYLLSIILIDGEIYSYDLFREYFIDNILMNKFASTLIWNLYDKNKKIITTFRYLGKDKYIDSENKEIKIDADSFVGLASPVEMDDKTINKWIKHLKDYQLSQPLEQLKLVKLNKNSLQKEVKKLSIIEGTYGAFKDFAKRYEMYAHDKFGETYTFQSNYDDIFSISADIDEDIEHDDIIEIKLSFGNQNYNKISSRFIYTFLVFIICSFKLNDFIID